ncbi:PaaX family transcriptional regulator C-terminal domain-containing protein [Actinoplanes sp. ATCC 53533]|uniref:PaaX family transcriptional regulator C-terminal domain-containing protein n=1 Tax=Actinoplanes sp. ATCC 53533 TaxID=1288362 RepID=UPI0013154176|nr:PaaX family transcriptional regulator C-terminal domain-containing protein [Actinoplanes sp. ATCC 53533]
MRTRLRWSGFGTLRPGVWISTHTDRAQDAEIVLREAGVFEDCQIFRSEYLTGGDPSVIVRQAWDLDDVEQEYEAFLSGFTRQPSNDPLVRSTRLVHAWRRLALLDPALPMELLPARWIGARATKLFRRQRANWLPTAAQEWERISSQAR